MPLTPGLWDITVNGVVGSLTFAAQTGPVSGTIFGEPFVGFFDETSQTLTLLRNPQVKFDGGFNGVLATPFSVFQGSLFPQFTPPGGTPVSVLSGVFSIITGANSATYTTWFAQNPPPVKFGKEGKDGKEHKYGKDKEQKDHKEKEPPDKLPEFHASAPLSFGPPLSSQSDEPGSATGQSFIEAGERPSVGEAALQDVRVGERIDL
jgi:hypothetical protein